MSAALAQVPIDLTEGSIVPLITVEQLQSVCEAPKPRSDCEVKSDLARLFREAEPNKEKLKYSFLMGAIIVLEGLIGVGKSTLGESLYEYLTSIGLDVVWFPEEIPEPLLSLYTESMNKYAFPFQVIVARDRKVVLTKAHELSRQGKIVLIDRCLLGDYAFGLMQKEKGFFNDEEFESYMKMISTNFPHPTYTVFLDCPPEVAFERMKRRGNKKEINGYTLEYFQDLDQVYRRVVLSTHHLKVDWTETVIKKKKISRERCREFLDLLWAEHLSRIQ